jgi:hypothetical protein
MPTNKELEAMIVKLMKRVDEIVMLTERLDELVQENTRLKELLKEKDDEELVRENTRLKELLKEKDDEAVPSTPPSESTWASYIFHTDERPNVQYQNVISAVKIETNLEKSKANNMMVFGLELSKGAKEQDDRKRVAKVFKEMGVGDTEIKQLWRAKVRRLNSNNKKPPPILVEFPENKEGTGVNSVRTILKLAKNLKHSKECGGVFLAPDLTRLEREYGKRLRAERDMLNKGRNKTELKSFYYGIRGNQIVKLKIINQTQTEESGGDNVSGDENGSGDDNESGSGNESG